MSTGAPPGACHAVPPPGVPPPAGLPQLANRLPDQLLQRRVVDVVQRLDVQASRARRVLSQLVQKVTLLIESTHQIEAQVLFTRGETRQEPIPFSPARAAVVVLPASDDAAAPQRRLRPGGLLHPLRQDEAILALPFIGHAPQETF